MQNVRENKISASGVSPKWVKRNERRRKKKERKKERAKVSNNIGQYISLDQKKEEVSVNNGQVNAWTNMFYYKQCYQWLGKISKYKVQLFNSVIFCLL